MNTYYLFDMHVPLANIGTDARLVDVVTTTSPSAEFRVDGLTPIRVPEGVRVINPTNLDDLLAQKYQGLLAQYPGFGSIVFDDLLTPDGVQITEPPSSLRKSGSRSTIGGTFRTLVTGPNADVSPTVISQCIFVCEHYAWRYVDSKSGRVERYYVEALETNHVSNISVSAGSSFTYFVTSGSLVSFLPSEQGSVIQLEFLTGGDALSANRLVHTGSWAVIY